MVLADLFSAVLVLVFGGAAVAKLVGQKRQLQTAEKLQISLPGLGHDARTRSSRRASRRARPSGR